MKQLPRRTPSRRTSVVLLVAALLGLFGVLAVHVATGRAQVHDTAILLAINQHASSLLDTVALTVTHSGDMVVIGTVGVLVLAYLLRRHQRAAATQIAIVIGGAAVLNTLLKLIFQRDRPELWELLTYEATYSFPSGHALMTSVVAGLLIAMTWRSNWRWWTLSFGVLYTVLVGLSRLYLGVHYPSDVLAGWCVGAVWVLIVVVAMKAVQKNRTVTQ